MQGLKSNSKIYYITPFLPKKEKYKLHYSPAAQAKSDYIRSKIATYNSETVCVNCSLTVDNSIFFPEKVEDENGKCRVLFSISLANRFFTPILGGIMLLSVFFYILLHVGKNDTVILYHSIYYDFIVSFLKGIKGFKIVYEVEEIYADVRSQGKGRELEILKCNRAADAFIFPTELLDEIVNKDHKQAIFIYGSYKTQNALAHRPILPKKNTIVYSGTLMQGKGATQAIECAKALDSDCEIRIIGYGSEFEIETIKKLIDENKSDCKVVFDGMKFGDEYIEYLRNCDIGLCIQPQESTFNSSSFPSKILSYMNCGLKVVATEMEALKRSKLSECIFFSKNSSPKAVAEAIQNALRTECDSVDLINSLDETVSRELFDIFNGLHN